MHDPPEVTKDCVACKKVTKFHLKKKRTKQPEMRCKGCCSKRVVFTRMFGGWPIRAYNELSDEQKIEVWNSGVGKEKLFTALHQQVTYARIKESKKITKNKWLPKKAWILQGYEETNIETWQKKFDDETKDYAYTKTLHIDMTADISRDTKAELINMKDSQGLRGKLSHYVSTPSPSKGKKRGRSKKSKKSKKSKRSGSSNSNSSKSSSSSNSNSSKTSRAPSPKAVTPRTKAKQEKEEKLERIREAKEKKKIDAAAEREAKKAEAAAEKKAKKDRMGYKSIMT